MSCLGCEPARQLPEPDWLAIAGPRQRDIADPDRRSLVRVFRVEREIGLVRRVHLMHLPEMLGDLPDQLGLAFGLEVGSARVCPNVGAANFWHFVLPYPLPSGCSVPVNETPLPPPEFHPERSTAASNTRECGEAVPGYQPTYVRRSCSESEGGRMGINKQFGDHDASSS